MDEHVPRAVSMGLRLRGVDVLTVQEDGAVGRPDPWILDRATELGRLLFTQDANHLQEAHSRQRDGRTFAGVVYAHQLRLTIGQCIRDLELIAKASLQEEYANRVEYLPL
jgi:hypothetical protein